jgi:hypothetical protein
MQGLIRSSRTGLYVSKLFSESLMLQQNKLEYIFLIFLVRILVTLGRTRMVLVPVKFLPWLIFLS